MLDTKSCRGGSRASQQIPIRRLNDTVFRISTFLIGVAVMVDAGKSESVEVAATGSGITLVFWGFALAFHNAVRAEERHDGITALLRAIGKRLTR